MKFLIIIVKKKLIKIFVFTYLGAMLIDEKLVGKNLENFAFQSEMLCNSNGDRMFSNVNSGEFFRKAEKQIHEKWGPDVYPLLIHISMDKTHADRTGAQKIFPCYVGIGNLTSKINASIDSLYLVGFCPLLELTDSQINVFLMESGIITVENLKEANRMLRRYIENEFNKSVIAPVIEVSEKGPILYAVGVGDALVIKKFIPLIYRYLCKN